MVSTTTICIVIFFVLLLSRLFIIIMVLILSLVLDEGEPKVKLEQFVTSWVCTEPKGLIIVNEPGVRLNEVELRDTSALVLTSALVSIAGWELNEDEPKVK